MDIHVGTCKCIQMGDIMMILRLNNVVVMLGLYSKQKASLMDLHAGISNDYINQRREAIFTKFTTIIDPIKMDTPQLQSLHAQITKRQAEYLRLHSASQRDISKYFLTFQPLPFNPATFGDLRLYGGPRIAINHGKLYIGTIVDGKRHGKGVIISHKGKIYEGELMLNERNGVGVEIYQNSNFYIGGFVGSKREGEGRMVWVNQSTNKQTTHQYYSGSWKEGEPHGFGLHSTQGWTFMGNFKEGMRNGKGTEVKAGSLFDGNYTNNLRDGRGMHLQEGVQFYEGEYKMGRKHGYGKWKDLRSGEEYQGFFQDNKKEGIGVSIKDGIIYRGLFTEDRPNGTGEFTNTRSPLNKDKDTRILTQQQAKRSKDTKSRGELQSAQFVRSTQAPPLPLRHQLSVRSMQKIVKPPKMGKINTSRDKDKDRTQEEKSIKIKRQSLLSAKTIRVVNENPEKHACTYRHCSCHKWDQNQAEKIKIDQNRILRLFSARKSFIKSIV